MLDTTLGLVPQWQWYHFLPRGKALSPHLLFLRMLVFKLLSQAIFGEGHSLIRRHGLKSREGEDPKQSGPLYSNQLCQGA